MLVNVCYAKLHRATVTGADLSYVGSITLGPEIIKASGLTPGQMVQITNVSNAVLWRTYIIKGKKGEVVLNGPPARLFQKGDQVIVLGEAWVEEAEARRMSSRVLFFDDKNRITKIEEGKRP